jgi:hypothetical protein
MSVWPLRHYAITPLCHYAIMPLLHYANTAITPLRHYTITPVRQYGHYAITPLRQYSHYAITPVPPLQPLHHYATTPVRQYGHYAITPVRQYGHYAITPVHQLRPLRLYASTAITPVRQYGHYTIMPVRPLRHSPHSLASVKDMYVEMGFPLNPYQQPSILTFTDRHGREIGDYPREPKPVEDDDDPVMEYIDDAIPAIDAQDEPEIPGVWAEPTGKLTSEPIVDPIGVEMDSDPHEINFDDGLGQQDKGPYAVMPVRPLHQYASMAIMPLCQYGHYAIHHTALQVLKTCMLKWAFH